jgi:hypothetical protein
MSALAVSNDVLRASLRPPPPASLGTRLEQRAADWFPSFERWLIHALYGLAERAPWQRGAIGAALGALIGLGTVLGVAGVYRWQRAEVATAALNPHAVERAGVRSVAPTPPVPAAAVAEQTAPGLAVAERVIETPAFEAQPAIQAVKHTRKRSHSQRSAVRAYRSR